MVVTPEELSAALEDGQLSLDECRAFCEGQQGRGELTACTPVEGDASLEPAVACHISYSPITGCYGRYHAVLGRRSHGRGPSPVAAWLQRTAHAEAGSVLAFVTLHDELGAYGAPKALLERTLEAAMDEIGHARTMTALALRYGAKPPRVHRQARSAARPLLEMATENAVEACVGETFSALLARHQALHASDESVRTALTKIASEELGHAALAWDLHDWMLESFSSPEKKHVRQALQRAARRLAAQPHDAKLDAPSRRVLGLPSRRKSQSLASGLAARLLAWSSGDLDPPSNRAAAATATA